MHTKIRPHKSLSTTGNFFVRAWNLAPSIYFYAADAHPPAFCASGDAEELIYLAGLIWPGPGLIRLEIDADP